MCRSTVVSSKINLAAAQRNFISAINIRNISTKTWFNLSEESIRSTIQAETST